MRKLILRMEITLDDVAAAEKSAQDAVHYDDEGSWADVFATLETVDAMLIGSRMHREYLGHWKSALTDPKSSPNERKFAEIAA